MTPPKDQAPGLMDAIQHINEWLIGEGRMPRTPDITALLHAYEQLESENAELRGKLADGKEAAWDEAVDQARIAVADYHFNIIDAVCAVYNSNPYRTEQANIRSPVRDQYNPEDET